MKHDNLPGALVVIEASRASAAVRSCLRFVALTATRSAEVLGATWGEVDLQGRTWTIAAERMKGGVEHRVPLSGQAVAVLEGMRRGGDTAFVFPGRTPGAPLSHSTLLAAAKTMGLGGSVHGFRSSFRTWASECTDADHAVMELSLGHAVGGNVERAYARSDLFDKRRELMDTWASYIA